MTLFIAWCSAFLVTQVVEAPIYARALIPRPRRWILALGASTVTHPIVFFVFPNLGFETYWIGVSWAEAFAVAAEALYLSALSVRYSVIWSLVANGASVAVGLGLRYWTGWP